MSEPEEKKTINIGDSEINKIELNIYEKTDSRKGEISKRDLKEIDEWFKALKKLLSEKQITEKMFNKVVEYVIDCSLPSTRFFVEDFKRNLANYPDWRERLYLDKKEDDLKEVRMSVSTARIHQILTIELFL